MSATSQVLEARDLVVMRGGKTLVRVTRFAVEAGEVHVLLGPNGAGKTTLLRALNGLERAEGELRFAGRPVRNSGDRLRLRRHTAAVFQQSYLLATSVRGNVESGLRIRGVRGHELRRRAQSALEMLAIEHLAERRRNGLSGGEAQRVSVARALAVDPMMLFLDEPMASLDPPTRRGLIEDLETIFRRLGTAVLWVTHDTEEALAVADRVTFLDSGRVVQQGATTDVFNNPATQEVADYLGLDVWIEGVVRSAETGASRFVLPNGSSLMCGEAPAGPAFIAVHPEDVLVLVERPARDGVGLRNIIEARIREVRPSGRSRVVVLDWDGGRLDAMLTRAACEELGISRGQVVYAAIDPSVIRVLSRGGG